MSSQPTWWAIRGDAFLEALTRASSGESPDLLYAEFYANSEIEDVSTCVNYQSPNLSDAAAEYR